MTHISLGSVDFDECMSSGLEFKTELGWWLINAFGLLQCVCVLSEL